MRVEDLRIGNLVLIAGETRQISGIIGELIYAQHTDAHKVLNAPDAVFGIPLTEEWLIRCGFSPIDDDGLWICNTEPLFQIQNRYLEDEGNFDHIWDASFTEAPIEFVHQIQNLYYALTGEELKLAQSPQTN